MIYIDSYKCMYDLKDKNVNGKQLELVMSDFYISCRFHTGKSRFSQK